MRDSLQIGAVNEPKLTLSVDSDPQSQEIRTKVFRIGAPLLRSTIPVSLGKDPSKLNQETDNVKVGKDVIPEDEDVETVLSLSDVEFDEDDGQSLAVTLDFQC